MKNRLAEVMGDLNITPMELRDHLKVDRSNVYRWLANETQPSDINKKRISEFFHIPIGDIFFQDNDVSCASSNNQPPTGTEG